MSSTPVDRLTRKTINWLSSHSCEHRHSYLDHYKCFLRDFPEHPQTKRVLILADPHCGSTCGLTPPQWQATPSKEAPERKRIEEATRQQLWRIFKTQIDALKPFDLVILNGDAIDGKNPKAGATGLLTADRNEQIQMAADVLKATEAPQYVVSYGTGYHVGSDDDFEKQLESRLDAPVRVKGHAFVDVNGCILDCKHKVAGSQLPHGRATAALKEKMWADVWRDVGVNPNSNIIIRSHVHYYEQVQNSYCTAVVTPALQGLGTKYGTRECSGLVDWGFLWADIEGPDNFEIRAFVPREVNELQKVEIIKA